MTKQGFIQQVEESEEFQLLSKVVGGTATVDHAVQDVVNKTMVAFATHGSTKHGGLAMGGPDYNVSLAVMELTQRLEPAQQHRVVEFVSQLQKQVAVDPSTNEPLKVQGTILWTDMPSFGYTELETWYEAGGSHQDPTDPNLDPEEKDRWVRLNAFIAQLTQIADVHYTTPEEGLQVTALDRSLRAIWVMAMALENERPPETLVNTAALRAACWWFIYAADRLWENVQNDRRYPPISGAGPGGKYEGRGWTGYTQDRWQIWEQGLQSAQASCTDPAMEKLIGDALANMRRMMIDH